MKFQKDLFNNHVSFTDVWSFYNNIIWEIIGTIRNSNKNITSSSFLILHTTLEISGCLSASSECISLTAECKISFFLDAMTTLHPGTNKSVRETENLSK